MQGQYCGTHLPLNVDSSPLPPSRAFILDALPVLVYYLTTMRTTAGRSEKVEAKVKAKAVPASEYGRRVTDDQGQWTRRRRTK